MAIFSLLRLIETIMVHSWSLAMQQHDQAVRKPTVWLVSRHQLEERQLW
jgi:hypothetical protein